MIEKIYFPSFLFGWSGKVEEWKKWVKKEELCPRKKKVKKQNKKTKQNLYHSQKRISEKTTRFMHEEKKRVKKLPPKRKRERERERKKK